MSKTHFLDMLGFYPIPLITSQLKWAKSLVFCFAIGEKICFFFFSFPVENCLHCTAMLRKFILSSISPQTFYGSMGNIKCKINK